MTTSTINDRPATRDQLAWLTGEVRDWESRGVLTGDQAATILDGYRVTTAGRRFSLARLLLTIGAAFVGIGLIWLVGANLDQLAPTTRFLVVAGLWLAFLVGSEVLHERRPSASLRVGAGRLLAALASGAVIFQAAQSMQVPAYEPALVGLWAAGALAHAYAVRGVGPLIVGLVTGATWFMWQALTEAPNSLTAVLCLAAGGVVAVSVGALHARRSDRFAAPWQELGILLSLVALFAAALPFVNADGFEWNAWLVVGIAAAAVAAGASLLLARGPERLAALGSVGVLAVCPALVLWQAGADAAQPLSPADWAHAGICVAAYVAAAVGVAVLGTLQESWRLNGLATLALVTFTTFQSFAVFAQIIQGAWLFVVLGLVLLGTGYLFDRARRELAATLEGVDR
jgi:uncharacterized membrane protein